MPARGRANCPHRDKDNRRQPGGKADTSLASRLDETVIGSTLAETSTSARTPARIAPFPLIAERIARPGLPPSRAQQNPGGSMYSWRPGFCAYPHP